MNGQDPNLNNGVNGSNTLGTTTLGMAPNMPNVNAVPTPNDASATVAGAQTLPNEVPNPQSGVVETLDIASNEPVAKPIPGTEGMLTGSTIGANNNFTPNNNVNDFTNANKVENIGQMPPNNNETKKKRKGSKLLFILLIIVLICAVSYGVYYFLSISNSVVKLTTKNVTIGVGESIPDDIKEYATATSGNISTCSLNTKNVNAQVIGEYEVTITCGKNTYTTKLNVSDITAPTAILNVVFKTVGSTIATTDFVKSCTDASNCVTHFADESKVNEYLNAVGTYNVDITAQDDVGNSATYTTTLYVTSEQITYFANFFSKEEVLTDYKGTKTITDVLALNNTLTFLNVARRDYKYTFENESDYNKVVGLKESTITFDGITGVAIYDDSNLSFVITTDLSIDTLNSENNGSFPTNYQDIQAIYKDTKGYTPSFTSKYTQNSEEVTKE